MSDDPPEPTPMPEPPSVAPEESSLSPVPPLAPEHAGTSAVTSRVSTALWPRGLGAHVRRFAFLAIPVIALLELGAYFVQTHSVVSDSEWLAARDVVRGMVRADDLVAVAPYWADPVGRELFRDEILSVAREARPDATRFPRAIEVSIRGQHLREFDGWKVESKRKVGPVTLTVLDNPAYTPLRDDLVDHVAPGKMSVSVVSSNGAPAECTYTRTKVETGGLGFGPAVPGERFVCPGAGLVGASVMQTGDYRPHRCLFAPPLGSGKTMRVRFEGVTFGQLLHGHAGIDWDSTAHTEEPPVTLVWKLGDRTIGRVVAGNTDGWKGFALDTRDVDGEKGEVVAEISSLSSRNRLFCFEADTR